MKKLTAAFMLFTCMLNAQNSLPKVWDLLLTNKREDARKLFDKDFKKKADTDIELLLLDAIIDQQSGRLSYNKEFLTKFSKFSESSTMLYPIWYYPFVIGSVSSEGYDDLAYEKMDFITSLDNYKTDPFVIYNKAIFDRKRLNYKGFDENIAKLDAIQKWQFCGVFENMNGSGLETDYEPELYARNDKLFNANSNGFVNWYTPLIPQNEGCHFYINESEYGNGIMYAQTFIEADTDKEVILNFASGGGIKLFVNDVQVYVNDKIERSDINAYLLKFNLKKGINRLVIKSATSGGSDYFYASLKDNKQNVPGGIVYYDTYKPYNKSTLAELNPVEVAPVYETYLSGKLKAFPNNILYKLLLFNAYINNNKTDEAYNVIEGLTEKYPNSSLLATYLIQYYSTINDDAKVEELKKNLLLNDEGYFYSLINKFGDSNWLKQANVSELEKYRDLCRKLQTTQYTILFDYVIALRNSDIDLSLKKLDELMAASYNNEVYASTFAEMYAELKGDKQKTIDLLEKMLAGRENVAAQNILIKYYYNLGRKDDVKKLINQKIEHYPYFNNVYDDAITVANNANSYEESLKYTDTGLKNFPYSFKLLEQKGRVYNSLKDTKEAEKYFKESLIYHSGNTQLRKTMYDIAKVPDEIEQVATKDLYSTIKKRRNSKMYSDYGVNILLDEFIVNILPEGGRKSKITYIYEVTAENGIEELKEYEISGNNVNIIKAEIVKPDGSIVPGDKDYTTVVFAGLKVNDVVYIQYETMDNSYGRFYKDFNFGYHFNGVYPSQQTIYGIIYPNDTKFTFNINNGDIPSKTVKLNGRNYQSWELKNIPVMPLMEDYAPKYNDISNKLSISSIKSWTDISNWYADLVKKSMTMDNVAIKAYNDIFPKGTSGMGENDIAFKIYKYIEENITYSSLDFRQSGYVPQKPSKTISSKLGDCKDVSTLFVAFAERAGLKANLVLVQTNNNGRESLKLPSISFNHCIVKVILEGKEYFIEMTDNYMPFKALPLSLYKAKALVISFNKAENEKAGLINIPFTNALSSNVNTATTLTVEDGVKKFSNIHTLTGEQKAYYNELFSNATTYDYRKKEIEDNFNKRLNKVILLEDVKLIANERFNDDIKFLTKFSISEKLQSVGSLKIMEIPFIDKVYTRDIIASEKRNYDIDYSSYENVNNYKSEVIINIGKDKKFTEIPQNHEFTFKSHKYKITYELISPASLKVMREVAVTWDTIKAAEYPAFKKYVEEVIATEEEIVGFK